MAPRLRVPVRRSTVVSLAASAACAATLTLVTACGGGSSKPAGRVAAAVVVHPLNARTDDTVTAFKSEPASPVSALPSGDSAGGVLTAQAFPGVPGVGALFFDGGDTASIHYCTASVVHSASGDVIVTAAHCVYGSTFGGYQNHILYVPGYHDGVAPYGTWVATSATLDQRWIAASDPDADVAFLTVRRVGDGTLAPATASPSSNPSSTPGTSPGGPGTSPGTSPANTLEAVTGTHALRATPSFTDAVTVIGYPFGDDKPVGCTTHTTRQSASQLRFDCGGFPDGSSGGPFLAADGAVVGVVGGYQEGGLTPEISYSCYFDADVDALYKAAASRT